MAAIEKMDEYDGIGCGWKMYKWKRDHIQVSSQNRKVFKNKKAVLFLFKEDDNSLFHIDRWGGYTRLSYNKEFYEKINGKWCEWRKDWKKPWWDIAKPIYVAREYSYCLYVPELQGEVNGCYYNTSFNMATVKRRINRMMGYKVDIVKMDITEKEFYSVYKDREQRIKFFNIYYDILSKI